MHEDLTFYELLRKFSKRMEGTPLAKATSPNDFSGIRRALDPHGSETVDHIPHLTAHPPSHQAIVDRYSSIVHPSTPVFKRHSMKLEGVTKKIAYALPRQGDPSKTDGFLIKPYHERITKPAKPWMHHTIQGWAEMTNQGIWHAAGLGHIHQLAHTATHNMGLGFEAEPAIVIAMHPRAKMLTAMHPKEDPYGDEAEAHWQPSMIRDLPMIGAMDFLTNNLDRHEHNLMYIPSDHHDDGVAPKSHLVAIDHGRNFQYKSSIKGMPKFVMDHGVKRPIEPWEMPDPTQDDLQKYVVSRAGKFLLQIGKSLGHEIPSKRQILEQIAAWWPHVSQEVVNEFWHHLNSIKKPDVRAHIKKNFMERTALLDRLSSGQADLKTKIPIHQFEEK